MGREELPEEPEALLSFLRDHPKEDPESMLTLYTRALPYLKSDRASLEIFLGYIELAVPSTDHEDVEHLFSLMKVKLRGFKEYWERFIEFETKERGKKKENVVCKALEYLRVKTFPGKEELARELKGMLETAIKSGSEEDDKEEINRGERSSIEDSSKVEDALEWSKGNSIETPNSKLSLYKKTFTTNKQSENNKDKSNNCAFALEVTGLDDTLPKKLCERREDSSDRMNLFECRMLEETGPLDRVFMSTVRFKGRELVKFSKIGKGGFSVVYRVLMEGEVYALKQISVTDREGMSVCRDEIFLLEKLKNHEFVIKMIDYEVLGDTVNILLEYGETDLQRLIQSGPLNMFFVKYLWESILKILVFIHGNRIVHRDIKPANFVLVKGKVKLIDFGISKSIRGDTTSILNIENVGTLNYISPEQCTGKRVGRASDMWSAGCILFNMIYRKNVYPARTVMDVVRFISEERPILYGPADDDLAVDCIKKCLVYDPKSRAKPEDLLAHPFLSK